MVANSAWITFMPIERLQWSALHNPPKTKKSVSQKCDKYINWSWSNVIAVKWRNDCRFTPLDATLTCVIYYSKFLLLHHTIRCYFTFAEINPKKHSLLATQSRWKFFCICDFIFLWNNPSSDFIQKTILHNVQPSKWKQKSNLLNSMWKYTNYMINASLIHVKTKSGKKVWLHNTNISERWTISLCRILGFASIPFRIVWKSFR